MYVKRQSIKSQCHLFCRIAEWFSTFCKVYPSLLNSDPVYPSLLQGLQPRQQGWFSLERYRYCCGSKPRGRDWTTTPGFKPFWVVLQWALKTESRFQYNRSS
ncbi:hypothetical protein V6N13_064129 [Hibiscus sabdariffa]|uniref:Uncharacterized protein n=1 Tax=Hibiscus sabdariffa TaxID=183260 RepID=A0ABR2R2M6_9ROSI